MEDLYLDYTRQSTSLWHNHINPVHCRRILRLFGNVRTL
jgi:hypothetical protein